MFKKMAGFLKANKFYAAYNFDNAQMKQQLKHDFYRMSAEERINTIATAYFALLNNGLAASALNLFADYKEELCDSKYDVYRGGPYREMLADYMEENEALSSEMEEKGVKIHVHKFPSKTNMSEAQLQSIELHEQEVRDLLKTREIALNKLDSILLDASELQNNDDVKGLLAYFETVDERNFIFQTLIKRGIINSMGQPLKNKNYETSN
jgi:arsenate reductase-like glutaredoxin family protein